MPKCGEKRKRKREEPLMVRPTKSIIDQYLTTFRTIYGIIGVHLGYHEVYVTEETKMLRKLMESISFVSWKICRIDCA